MVEYFFFFKIISRCSLNIYVFLQTNTQNKNNKFDSLDTCNLKVSLHERISNKNISKFIAHLSFFVSCVFYLRIHKEFVKNT